MTRFAFLIFGLSLFAVAGCSSVPDGMTHVTGKVRYSDGSPIPGEYAMIHFDPAPTTSAKIRKAAHAEIQPDGSFELWTVRPHDGAFKGDYRVTVEIKNDSRDTKSLVARQFTKSETTPLAATVTGAGDDFDFVVSK